MSGQHATAAQGQEQEHAERLLDAGAVLPVGTLAPVEGADSTADALTARSYRHPALDGRTVVRLVPGALGAAEDLAVEFLGLESAAAPVEVGQVRQEALGFPAWALVHDPANGHHALAVVKEMERLTRQVKSKPGNAKDGFDELAVRLGRAVPHFLPTYCEQVGRIFLEQGNQTYAATFFGKAREAERTHGLAVDEERLRAVFLEFALGGALTVKALRQYVKELAARSDALTAWQRFRQLCTERSAAGMAPYAGIAEDARSLIRAAGLDQREQERALIAELLSSSAVGRTPSAVWKSWRAPLVEAARQDAAVRARLLEILPDPSGAKDNAAVDEEWLGILRDSGAEDLLTGPREDGAEPVARWLQRWTAHLNRGWRARAACAATVELAARMVERLRADAVPVELQQNHPTALDLLDLLLAADVPVADPPSGLSFPLAPWLAEQRPGRRDLAAVAADPRFRPALRQAVAPVWGGSDPQRLTVLGGELPALHELFVEWADNWAEELEATRGLAGLHRLLTGLGNFRRAMAFANPAAAARIAGLDVAARLGRTLRAGILDELGWPALEEGLRRLGHNGGAGAPGRVDLKDLQVENAWPNLVLVRHDRAVVVGPEGVLLEHDLRVPAGLSRWHRPRLRYVDGELLVAWIEDNEQRAYWSGRPDRPFTLTGERIVSAYYGAHSLNPLSLPLPGGGRATGGRVLHAGDTAMPDEQDVYGDGTGHWVLRYSNGRPVLAEYDPQSGQRGRTSVPPLFAADGGSGTLRPERSRLLPLQPGLEHTPLGTDGTVLGGAVRSDGGRTVFRGVDGRRAELSWDGLPRYVPVGRLTLPGDPAPVLAETTRALDLIDPDGDGRPGDVLSGVTVLAPGRLDAAGTALVPPLEFWHALRPRDEAGSKLLRDLTDRQAFELIEAGWPVDAPEVEQPRRPERLLIQGTVRQVAQTSAATAVPLTATADLLPGLTDPRLLAGVAGLVRMATETATQAARFVPLPKPKPEPGSGAAAERPAEAPAYRPEHGRDGELDEALKEAFGDVDGFRTWKNPTDRWYVLGNLRTVADLLATEPAERPADWTSGSVPLAPPGERDGEGLRLKLLGGGDHYGWAPLLGRTVALVLAAASPLTDDKARAALLLMLAELTSGPFADRGPTFRQVTLGEQGDRRGSTARIGQVLRRGDRTVVVLACRRYGEELQWEAVDHDPSGVFGPVGHFTVVQERRVRDELPAAWIARFAELLRAHGPVAWRPEQAAAFDAATGIGLARATLLIAAPPGRVRRYGDPIPTERLAEYGLKNAQVDPARRWLQSLHRADLDAVQAALLPADPADLWTGGLDTDAAAACWIARRGRLVTLPDEAQATVNGAEIATIEDLLNPAATPWLARTTVQRVRTTASGLGLAADDPRALPNARTLSGAVQALRWLAHHLPYGSELRPLLPPALAAVRARIADPGLLLDLGAYSSVRDRTLPDVLRAHFGLPEQGAVRSEQLVECGEAVVLAPHPYGERAYLRPAALTGADDPLLDLLAGLAVQHYGRDDLDALRALLGEDLNALVTHGSSADEPVGWPQDPQRSAPELVAEVAAATGLGPDAAALYLQLLALPDPTDRNTVRWTGWKPARTKRARAELAATDLVLEAKRSRAGRSLFLPGGWQEAKAPALPVEVWKAGLYEIPAGRLVLPPVAAPELFARAWRRITAGDRPGYEQLVTNTRGRKRS
ncbi:hypothetical protein [Kitasatospora sp. NPDC088134]|uniref:hypothetical protein n=1 Tax=Kitasatospora sp. NPDC088134 TaxID=3364071 RepID=UPI00380212F6